MIDFSVDSGCPPGSVVAIRTTSPDSRALERCNHPVRVAEHDRVIGALGCSVVKFLMKTHGDHVINALRPRSKRFARKGFSVSAAEHKDCRGGIRVIGRAATIADDEPGYVAVVGRVLVPAPFMDAG